MDAIEVQKKQWLRDFGHYVIWFVIWGALFSFLQPVGSDQTVGTTFWGVKLQQSMIGAGFGVVCALVFTLLQNGINGVRRKWISWLLAIGTWVTVNLLLAVATGRLG